jgi:hypothetical protein
VAHQLGHLLSPVLGPALRRAQRQGERDEALLCAVVEVALDAAALGVGGLDDARAGVAQIGHLRGHRGVHVGAEQHLRV